MISRLRGKLVKKEEQCVVVEVGGIFYDINISRTVFNRLKEQEDNLVELVIYHYLAMDKNRGIPVMIGFMDELEKDFFEKFIGVSGIGPRVALRAFDQPVSLIAKAIEEGDVGFLKSLDGIGVQKAKHIVASLQGKVGRFVLLKEAETSSIDKLFKREVVQEAQEILKRLQYKTKEIEEMIKKALEVKPQADTVEELLNEIYKQRHN